MEVATATGRRYRKRLAEVVCAVVATTAFGCSSAAADDTVRSVATDPGPAAMGDLPASFQGELPCADCP
ncbi:MAG: hypothetical protein MUP13_10945, partial [Thermoanaerobaculales bacterium]|nr:hypothetical protein [Thermoanaerobaculales bacterium]